MIKRLSSYNEIEHVDEDCTKGEGIVLLVDAGGGVNDVSGLVTNPSVVSFVIDDDQ